jgi:anaerobic ribonucleoside-triphosphate reductase activating protein
MSKKSPVVVGTAAEQAMESINSRFEKFAVRVTGVSSDGCAFYVRLPYETHDTTVAASLSGKNAKETEEYMERSIAFLLDKMSDTLDNARRELTYGKRSVWVRVAGIEPMSVVDGPGLRVTVFFQGCPHKCAGCHNPQTHDASAGALYTVDEIMAYFRANPMLNGITLSGGEPLAQPAAARELAARVKAKGKNVVVYTGYEWRQVCSMSNKNPDIEELVSNTDILVDGPYVESQRSLSLPFRGSANQRLIDVQKTLVSDTGIILYPDTHS